MFLLIFGSHICVPKLSTNPGGGGVGTAIYRLYRVCAAVKGMVFKQFTLG